MTGDCYSISTLLSTCACELRLRNFIQIKSPRRSYRFSRCRKSYSGCVFSDVTHSIFLNPRL